MHHYYICSQVDRIEDPILRSALTTLLRLVEVIKDLVGKAGVYEEEDFQPLTYGFRLCSEVGEQKCIGQCKEAEEILAKEVRRTRNTFTQSALGRVYLVKGAHSTVLFLQSL